MNFGTTQQGEPLKLGMRNLYIVPTRFGLLWLAGIGLLQVVAIQLESNGPLLLSFLMLGLFLLTLHLTHFNLEGLELRSGEPAAGFAGDTLAYPLRLRAGVNPLLLEWHCRRRGFQTPGALLIRSTAPLGLFVCWSRWAPPVPQLVIPAPRSGPVGRAPAPAEPEEGARTSSRGESGGDLWHDLQPHRPEDGAGRLAWKLLAQGRGAHAKRFVAPLADAPLLTPAAGIPLERALEHLSAAILRLHGEGSSYGLVLGPSTIPPGQGPGQRDRCLKALALAPRTL